MFDDFGSYFVMILVWILDVSQYLELCVWRARFEVSRRLGRYCVVASILLDMCLGWRCAVFCNDFVYACRCLDVLSLNGCFRVWRDDEGC